MALKVLVACEESQAVCKALLEMGWNAFSCDIQPCSGGRPDRHIQGDVLPLINGRCEFETMDGKKHHIDGKWDLLIAHPPCTDLAVSGARWFPEKRKDGRQQASIDFFMEFVNADCDRIAIENPIGIMSTVYRKPDQIIQPWQFGHGETKATCLWLKGLPHLEPTNIVGGREQKVWRMAPGPERAKLRSKTFPGIAKAMAEQWTRYIEEERKA
jgi:site-specific DNA-cytosine methylase